MKYFSCPICCIYLLVGVCATLTWSARMKIALDAAKGLAFLHGAERSIIYRDFKTSNILLDAVSHQFFVMVLNKSSKAHWVEDKKHIWNELKILWKIIVSLFWKDKRTIQVKWLIDWFCDLQFLRVEVITCRILVQNFQTLGLQRMDLWETRPMCQHVWWAHMDMQLLSM